MIIIVICLLIICYLILGMATGLYFINNKFLLIIYSVVWPFIIIPYLFIFFIKNIFIFIDNLQ